MSAVRKVGSIPGTMSAHRKDAEREAWLCDRLELPNLFAGTTSTEMRRDRLKVVLIQRELTESIAGRADGKPIKWRDLYKQLYGEDLA